MDVGAEAPTPAPNLKFEQVAGDDRALDLAGAFVDGDDAGIAVHALDFGFAGVALAAVDLHGFVDDAIDHFAREKFGAGGGGAHPQAGIEAPMCNTGPWGTRGRTQILQEGGVVEEAAGGFNFCVHVGEHPLDGLEFADGFAKGFAGTSEFGGFVEGSLGEADGLRSDADAAPIERTESDS